ncbi:MAG: HNH endonuclease [Cyanobacteria bacterium J06638_22]
MTQERTPKKETSKRKNPSKRMRFEVFKRDGFTCQYCGTQPPENVLVCDHIDPVKLGGKTTLENLITACEKCNQGKAANPLGSIIKRPDADLMYLELQQEIAELKRFKDAEKERDELLRAIADEMQDRWMDITGDDYPPGSHIFIQMLRKYSPEIVNEAALITAKREADGQFRRLDDFLPYMWGVAKRISQKHEAQLEALQVDETPVVETPKIENREESDHFSDIPF